MTGYYWNVMWLDTIALFPLVALGIEKLIHENKHIYYYVTLTLTMVVNFYLAVMVCVFIALYFLVALFSSYEWKYNRKMMIQRSVRFSVLSILAAVTTCVILAPAAMALGQTFASGSQFPPFEVYKNILQIPVSHFLGAFPAVLARNEDIPNIYSGVLTVLLVPQYFLNRRINKREKILMAAMMIFMVLCSCIRPLDYMIHGFHFTANLPHRFVFVYSFFLLYMGYTAFLHLEDCNWKTIIYTAMIYAVIMVVSEVAMQPLLEVLEMKRILSDTDLILNMLLFCIYPVLLCLFLHKKETAKKGILLLLFGLCFAECQFSSIEGMTSTIGRETYIEYFDGALEAVDTIEEREAEEDSLFTRTEFRRFTTTNDAALLGYNGFGIFSSMAPGGISNLMQKLGIAAASNSYRYYDPTPLMSAIFDVRYLLNKDTEFQKEYYNYIDTFDNVLLYENERALPIGFMVDSEIVDWEVEDTTPFEVQNDLILKSTGITDPMLEYIEAESIETENLSFTNEISKTCFDYKLDNAADLSKIPTVKVTYVSDRDQYLYLYVEAENSKRFVYHTSKENQDRELSCGRSLIDVGYVSAGEEISIELSLTKRGEFEKKYRETGSVRLYAARYYDEVFQKAYDRLKQNPLQLTSFEDTCIEGTVHAEKDGILMTSIPYIKSWHVYVDGEETEKLGIGENGLIGIAVPAGDHTIRFEYRLKFLAPGAILSILGLVLFVLYSMWIKKNRDQAKEKVYRVSEYREEKQKPVRTKKEKTEKSFSVETKKKRKKKR